MTLVELVMQREQEEQLRVIEVAQKEILALKEENSKLVAAASETDRHLTFFRAFLALALTCPSEY